MTSNPRVFPYPDNPYPPSFMLLALICAGPSFVQHRPLFGSACPHLCSARSRSFVSPSFVPTYVLTYPHSCLPSFILPSFILTSPVRTHLPLFMLAHHSPTLIHICSCSCCWCCCCSYCCCSYSPAFVHIHGCSCHCCCAAAIVAAVCCRRSLFVSASNTCQYKYLTYL